MKMKFNILLITVVLISIITSCDKDFLNQYPKDELSDANFWKQPLDAELYVNKLYAVLPNDLIDKDIYTDNARQASRGKVERGVYDPTDKHFFNWWESNYKRIRKTYVYFENVGKIKDISNEDRKKLDGQVRFFNAYAYFQLVKFFGGVPYINKVMTIEETYKLTRMPVEQVVDSILKDLSFAVSTLPENWPDEEYGRITKGAALAFKARVELFFEKFNEAAQDAKAVMDLGVYELFRQDVNDDGVIDGKDYATLFYASPPGDPRKKEMILESQWKKDLRPNQYNLWNGPMPYGWGGINPLQNFVDAFETINGLTIDEDPGYDDAKPFENRDPRLEVAVLHHDEAYEYLGEIDTMKTRPLSEDAPTGIGTHADATITGYYQQKFFSPYEDVVGKDRENSDLDYPIIRYAEVLLIYAEALIQQDKDFNLACDAIDQVRTRVGMPVVDRDKYNTKDKLMELLMRERRVELCMEGQRWLDMRRWGIDYSVMSGDRGDGVTFGMKYDPETETAFVGEPVIAGETRSYQKHNRLWPIPYVEIQLNPNLTQNPGY
jgi:hypothetical protein